MPASCGGFAGHQSANATVLFALAVPVLVGAAGAAVDFSLAVSARTKMQAVADSAAIYSAREFQMAQSNPDKIAAVAHSYVVSQLSDVSVKTNVDAQAYAVEVVLEKDIELTLGKAIWAGKVHLRTVATAKMSGGLPLCLVALETKANNTLVLQKNARLTAPACIVYSNSNSPNGLVSKDDAVMQAGFICSAGGRVKTKDSNFAPQPQTDCPVIPDPLSARQGPTDVACNHTGKVLDRETATLQPGVYCGGLTVTNGSDVTLAPGIFIVRDGPLVVDGDSTLKGTGVALYMKGAGANFTFATASTISLSAPKDGPLAGILIFDDPTGVAAPEVSGKHAKADKSPREHAILSDDARLLLGTIYLPKGRLIIDATKPVADRSAYTVLVVHQLDLYEGPNLYLNTDYRASDVPVPKGVGPYGGKIMLTH
jgi:hypothetical protein